MGNANYLPSDNIRDTAGALIELNETHSEDYRFEGITMIKSLMKKLHLDENGSEDIVVVEDIVNDEYKPDWEKWEKDGMLLSWAEEKISTQLHGRSKITYLYYALANEKCWDGDENAAAKYLLQEGANRNHYSTNITHGSPGREYTLLQDFVKQKHLRAAVFLMKNNAAITFGRTRKAKAHTIYELLTLVAYSTFDQAKTILEFIDNQIQDESIKKTLETIKEWMDKIHKPRFGSATRFGNKPNDFRLDSINGIIKECKFAPLRCLVATTPGMYRRRLMERLLENPM